MQRVSIEREGAHSAVTARVVDESEWVVVIQMNFVTDGDRTKIPHSDGPGITVLPFLNTNPVFGFPLRERSERASKEEEEKENRKEQDASHFS